MFNARIVLPGLVIFLGLISFPLWQNLTSAEATRTPQPQSPAEARQCVEPTQYMREKHMDLLLEWRESAIRKGNRTYVASDGQQYEISLSGTCLSCHTDQTEFCDQCHSYVGVKPDCWDCHNQPKGTGNGS